jgi:hypothetical protein
MNHSAEDNIISFLKANPSKFAAAHLQRMSFHNCNGTLASPKAISRRLQENAEGVNAILEVSYINGNAHYQIREEHKKKVYSYIPITLPDGTRVMREVIS